MRQWLQRFGPGLAVAATGVGAGDMVAAAVAGSRYGMAVAWAVVLGAALKFVLNEGLARWQLATGTTLLEGWALHFGRPVRIYFAVYLVVWSFVVGGAMISACGLAGHALYPGLPVWAWGTIHSLVGILLVWVGRYRTFERLMKWLIAGMFLALIGCAWAVVPPWVSGWRMVREAAVPSGSIQFILGMIGGVGGSLTLLSYGYWIREKGWAGAERLSWVRTDLGAAYGLTAFFALALVVLASEVLLPQGATISGSAGVVTMAGMLQDSLGTAGYWAFVSGFWAAVFTSLLGVWQSVPYLFCDFLDLVRGRSPTPASVITRSRPYRGYLLYLGLAPLSLLFLDQPVFVIVLYAVVGALFMPFLAVTLLVMNRRRDWVGTSLRSGALVQGALILCVLLFGYLCWEGIRSVLG